MDVQRSGSSGGRHRPARPGAALPPAGSGGRHLDAAPAPLIVTADVDLLDSVLAAAAASGIDPMVIAEPTALRPLWAGAPVIVVGADLAPAVCELVLPRRTEVYLAGPEDTVAELSRWSVPLGAAVIGLPAGAGTLTAAIADATGSPGGTGRLIAVVGGSGGVGASSVAAALAVTAASRGVSAMLVDLDPLGGGIDLLVGAEAVPGWRWPRLAAAQGHLGDLTGQLPRVAGVDVLSTARTDQRPGRLSPEAVRVVVMSATRSHRMVVVDLPRTLDPAAAEVLRRADHTLLVVTAEVRSTAAAQQVRAELGDATTELSLIVRRPRSGGIDSSLVADALGVRMVGVVGDDPSLRQAAQRGDPPGRAGRSPLSRLGRRILADLEPGGGAG